MSSCRQARSGTMKRVGIPWGVRIRETDASVASVASDSSKWFGRKGRGWEKTREWRQGFVDLQRFVSPCTIISLQSCPPTAQNYLGEKASGFASVPQSSRDGYGVPPVGRGWIRINHFGNKYRLPRSLWLGKSGAREPAVLSEVLQSWVLISVGPFRVVLFNSKNLRFPGCHPSFHGEYTQNLLHPDCLAKLHERLFHPGALCENRIDWEPDPFKV